MPAILVSLLGVIAGFIYLAGLTIYLTSTQTTEKKDYRKKK